MACLKNYMKDWRRKDQENKIQFLMSDLTLYGIPESDLEALISVLKKNSRINEIILFGSRAKGTFNNGSDIDIALKGNNLKLRDILDATSEIEKLLLPYKTDLVIFARISEPALVDHIQRVGIVLFKRNRKKKISAKNSNYPPTPQGALKN